MALQHRCEIARGLQLNAGLIRLVVLLFELDDVVCRGLDLSLQGFPVVEQRLIFLL